jgi:hypothetical protein
MPLTLFAAPRRFGRRSGSWSGRRSTHRYSSRSSRSDNPRYRRNIRGRKYTMRERCGTKSESLDMGGPVEVPGLARMGRTSAAAMGVEGVEDLVVAIRDGILAVEVTTTSNSRYLSRRLHNSILYRSPGLII